MFSNSTEVFDAIESRPSGRERGAIKVARNTYLQRVTDDVAALTLYDDHSDHASDTEVLALYGRTHVKLALRYRYPLGWRRIGQFTLAIEAHRDFLPYVCDTNGDAVLYRPGLILDAFGVVMNPPMPSYERAMKARVGEVVEGCPEYARTAVAGWDTAQFEVVCPECFSTRSSDIRPEHLLAHVDGELDPVLPQLFRNRFDAINHPDFNLRKVTKQLSKWLLDRCVPAAIEQIDPNFSYSIEPTKEIPT